MAADITDARMISIHTPTKGATLFTDGADRRISISIHTPTKGATQADTWLRKSLEKFQSTLPRRERLIMRTTSQMHILFQSTLPRRERLQY